MKKYFLLPILAILLLAACSEESIGPVVKIGNLPAITSPSANASFVLKEETANNEFATFTWTGADFGFDAGVSYSLEMDLAGKNFAEPVVLGTLNGLTLSTTNGKINGILLAKGVPAGEPINVELRVAATVNPDVPVVYSAPLTIKVTPFKFEVVYPKLQVPGSYQGWNPAEQSTVIHSVKSNGKFEGFLYFTADNTEFKYTNGPSWDVNYGDDGADGTLDKSGANIVAPTAGVYRLNVDINALTHKYVKTNWGLIGSATPNGWDADQDMAFDPTTGIWSITLNLKAGEMKFRANDDWGINFGDTDANRSLEYDGTNIAVAEDGNYTIQLILNVPDYTYKIVKN